MTTTKHEFQSDVSRLLDIVANALYSEQDVFLRELVSNASDASDKRRYLALSDTSVGGVDDYKIVLKADAEMKTLTVSDTGIGMDEADLIENLGTIARSGTAAFFEQMKTDKQDGDKASLIGQFGVGFYAAFMVSSKVEVITKKAGTDKAYKWISDGVSGYEIEETTKKQAGTDICLYLKEDTLSFLEKSDIARIVMRYSDHIDFPIMWAVDGEEEEERLNQGSALWARPKSEITDEQYQQFYTHIGAGYDMPAHRFHWNVEGMMEYTSLLYIPSIRPYDLFDPKRPHGVKLYVKRVYITDHCEGLVPPWLRFLRGVVDSQDLPLNISREMLQTSPMVAKISNGITKKVLSELETLKKDEQIYVPFWTSFGSVLKEGLYEPGAHREKILDLCLFNSTYEEGFTSLEDYVSRMKEGQKEIYYLQGDNLEAMRKSPQLEALLDKGIEVLLLDHVIDSFWVPAMALYKETAFKSITQDGLDLSGVEASKDESAQDSTTERQDEDFETLLEAMKETLKNQVKDVKISTRLSRSPVCLVADKQDADLGMEKLLKQQQNASASGLRILEINPNHQLLQKLKTKFEADAANDYIHDATHMLLDQARLVEGEFPRDIAAFNERLNSLLMA